MKLLLLTSVVCFAAVLAAPGDKQKREILPGDPRYGTDNHHHHHHHTEHENEVQISKAAGGYAGSYTIHDEGQSTEAQPQPHSAYGPPNHKVGQPLGSDFVATSDNAKASVPSTSYGIPDAQFFDNYIGSIEENKSNAVVKNVHDLNNDYQAPFAEAPTSFYSSAQTTIHEHPKYDVVQKSVIPEFHHVQQPVVVNKHVETVSVPQVKVTTSLPVETQGVARHSVPSFTSSIRTFPSYSSYSSIPVKTVDHHVHVQIPQPYPVPVTKQVTYPVPVPHRVEVPKPYYVRVPQPIQVPVNRPYPVEVPRPVPYTVPHYVRTSVPVIHPHHLTLDATRAPSNSFQTLFENAQLQNVLANLPSFQNPLEGFQNAFENFELPSFLPNHLPSFIPSQSSTPVNNVPSAPSPDAVTINNPALKVEKPQPFKPATTCAGCSVGAVNGGSVSSASSSVAVTAKLQNKAQEHVQPTDVNGGYVY